MNKKIIIVLAAVLLVAAACNKKASVNTETESTTKSDSGTQSLSASNNTSLKGLITAGKPVTCTFSDNGNTGTTYAADGKARTDITTTTNGQTMTAHTLIDGQTSYTWIDGQTTGFKTTLSASANSSASTNTAPKVDPDKTMDYTCSAWATNSTTFALPTGIQFMDMSSIKIPGK